MIFWLVLEGYDCNVRGLYDSKEMADRHAREMDCYVEEVTLLTALPLEITDPTEIKKREQQREQDKRSEEQLRHDRESFAARDIIVPSNGCSRLCHCEIFMEPSRTVHGYCPYCGCWAPEVFREFNGEDQLVKAINLLSYHDRVRMREICGLANEEINA